MPSQTRIPRAGIAYVIITRMPIRRLQTAWTTLMDRQHRLPDGWLGRLIGERMVRQHTPETLWTLQLLALGPDDRVLELGFGAGRALQLALQQVTGGQVVGVDLSPAMLQSARRRLKTPYLPHSASLICADILSLPLRAGSFDKIFSIHTFYFWQHSIRTLQHLYALLAPRGRLALTMATAKRDARGHWVHWPLQAVLEQETLPALHEIGFRSARLEHGPDSRAYNNVALVAEK